MARRTAESTGGKIAVLGAASPAGAHVKAALADRGVPGERVALFGLQSEVAVLSEYDGEARLVQSPEEMDPSSQAAVFVCEAGHDHGPLLAASGSGTLVVDLTGTIPNAELTGVRGASGRATLVAVPHPLTTLLTSLLAPVHQTLGVTGASLHVMRPASDFGEAGLEELREQTVHLLRFEPIPTDVFGRQLAFNVLPEHLFPDDERESTSRVARETRALMALPDLPMALTVALVPLFFGHAISAHLELARHGRDEAWEAWRAAPDVAIAGDPDCGATLDAPEGAGLLICRADAVAPRILRVWALGSEAGATAAARGVAAGIL
jgi:aspartate-semialdehyde dehydrogenase